LGFFLVVLVRDPEVLAGKHLTSLKTSHWLVFRAFGSHGAPYATS
jgi:hypothetical protein